METYILQKDLPNLKAGAEFIKIVSFSPFYAHNTDHRDYINGRKMQEFTYDIDVVENNPEWFKLK